jgi:RNA polymerase sigma-70 factor (ECF subfamily)
MNPDPGELANTNLSHHELRQALMHLREEYQEVLILRFLNEMSPKETAKVMKRSTGAVRVLQHRALAAIRKSLEEKYDQRIR